jgi:hypothetical protein
VYKRKDTKAGNSIEALFGNRADAFTMHTYGMVKLLLAARGYCSTFLLATPSCCCLSLRRPLLSCDACHHNTSTQMVEWMAHGH